jgi:hypothetical protein
MSAAETKKRAAKKLRELLDKYSRDSEELATSRRLLDDVLHDAEAEQTLCLEDLPCDQFFADGGFADWPDLELAYSDFYATVMRPD